METKSERQRKYERLVIMLKHKPNITNREIGEKLGISEVQAGSLINTLRRANPKLVPDRNHGIKVDWDAVKMAYNNA